VVWGVCVCVLSLQYQEWGWRESFLSFLCQINFKTLIFDTCNFLRLNYSLYRNLPILFPFTNSVYCSNKLGLLSDSCQLNCPRLKATLLQLHGTWRADFFSQDYPDFRLSLSPFQISSAPRLSTIVQIRRRKNFNVLNRRDALINSTWIEESLEEFCRRRRGSGGILL